MEGGAHLVTLIGPGGAGKTRLATRFGARHLDEWEGGVWFADLTEATDEQGLRGCVASALDVPLVGGDPDQLQGALASRGRAVLILDILEQVVAAAGRVVPRWLAAAPKLTLLTTSREALRVAGEQILELSPLSVPDGDRLASIEGSDAVALFVERARCANPRFVLNDSNASDVAEIVRQLDGMPLAIELAASRARMLTPARMLARLDERFRLLRGDRRDRTERQLSLRGAIAWSWDLLDRAERLALAQCSVFAGSFGLESAEAVVQLGAEAPDALDVLQALLHKSLLRSVEGDADARFSLLTSIRLFAAEQLPLGDGAQQRHAAWFARAAADAFDEPYGAGPPPIMADLPNLRLVARTAQPAQAVACLSVLAPLNRMVGGAEGMTQLCREVRARCPDDGLRSAVDVLRVNLLRDLGVTDQAVALLATLSSVPGGPSEAELFMLRAEMWSETDQLDRLREALPALSRAVDEACSDVQRIRWMQLLGHFRWRLRSDDPLPLFAEAARLAAEHSDRELGMALGNLGGTLDRLGRLSEALPVLRSAVAAHQRAGNRGNAANVHAKIGGVLLAMGRNKEAAAVLAGAADELGALGLRKYEVGARRTLAHALILVSKHDEAWEQLELALTRAQRQSPARRGWVRVVRAFAKVVVGDDHAALAEMEQAHGAAANSEEGRLTAALIAGRLGDIDAARAALALPCTAEPNPTLDLLRGLIQELLAKPAPRA
jgi:predicted ATPase/tetratricopeptide (TPR) repeat protein